MDPLALHIVPLSIAHAEELCLWRHEPPYDIYNWPSWPDMLAGGDEFADPVIRETQYRAVVAESGDLIGFIQFFPMAGVTRLGLGLRPDLCGRRYGSRLAQETAREALRRTPGNEIDLEVRTDNIRARKAYEKAGFRVTDEYERMTPTGPAFFYCMVYAGLAVR